MSGNDSPIRTRNPSPPPELQEDTPLLEADTIHSTIYSKHWLFSTLIKIIQEVEKENKEESDTGLDIDEELQNELCKLWDMSMNSEVSKFLHEFKAIEIFSEVIRMSKSPRITEISIGILNNMACVDELCMIMASQTKLRELVISLLEGTDPQVLTETARFLYTSLSNIEARDIWKVALNQNKVKESVCFILQSSTNDGLLKNVGEFLDVVLDIDDDLCEKWSTTEFARAVLEAIKQIGCHRSDDLASFLHVLQLLSTTEKGAIALVECGEELEAPILKYLNIICEEEIVDLEHQVVCLASALSVLNIIFSANHATAARLVQDEKLIRIFLKILEPCVQKLDTRMKQNDCKSGARQSVSEELPSQDLQTSSQCVQDFSTHKIQEQTHINEQDDLCYKRNSTDANSAQNENLDNCKSANDVENSCAKLAESCNKSHTEESKTSFIEDSTNNAKTDPDENTEHLQNLNLLYGIIRGFTSDFINTMLKISEERTQDDHVKQDKLSTVLSYLDQSSRGRLTSLLLTLKDCATTEYDPVAILLNLAKQGDHSRLVRILNDTLT